VKKFENRSTFAEVMNKSQVYRFFDSQCIEKSNVLTTKMID